jgi:hypothetical protein
MMIEKSEGSPLQNIEASESIPLKVRNVRAYSRPIWKENYTNLESPSLTVEKATSGARERGRRMTQV